MEQMVSPTKVDKNHFLRELLFKSLYAYELGSNIDSELFEMIAKDISKRTKIQFMLQEHENKIIIDKLNKIVEKKESLDIAIKSFLVGWKMNRLPMVDLSILRMSVYDLFYNDSVPNNVVISEAVILAQNFSDEKDKRFINGILSSVLKALTEADNDPDAVLKKLTEENNK